MKKGIIILLCCVIGVCILSTCGVAKEWSLNDEVYACGTSGMTMEELASAGVTLLSHAPWGWEGKTPEQVKAFLNEAHQYGIKVIPYVSLYKVIDSHEVKDTFHTKDHPFWKELDLVDHPEWALIDENGNIRRPFNSAGYRSGVQQSCTNVAGLAEAYVRGVKNLMEMGCDGVFVDNAHPTPVCYGPKFGKHKHLYPDKDNVYTYHLALKQVYDLVKQYGNDKVVMTNTGVGPNPVFRDCEDGSMVESYLCAGFTQDRERYMTFEKVIEWPKEQKHIDYIASGKAIVTLSYLGGTKYPIKEDAFFTKATAEMSNFLWTTNVDHHTWTTKVGDHRGNDAARLMLRMNLKDPLTEIEDKEGVTYRVFSNGIAAVNPSHSPVTSQLPAPAGFTEICDYYSGVILPVSSGHITVHIPPESGRIYIHPDTVFSSYLKECPVAAKGVQYRLDELRDMMAVSTKNKLDQWFKENFPAIESLSETYKQIPKQDDRDRFISELAFRQKKLPELINCQSDEIITRRFENLREYSGRLLAIAAGLTFTIDAPKNALPGETITAKVHLNNNTDIQNVKFALEVPEGWKTKSIPSSESNNTIDFKISIPQTSLVKFPKTLTAIASLEYTNKQNNIPLTLVQTHDFLIADKKDQ